MLLWNIGAYAVGTSAKSAILINADTGEILYEQNAYDQLPMASTTKIMTALLLAEQEDMSVQVCCTKEMVTVEGSSMGLLPGDYVTYNDLLYGMLLASGNDAANTTAIALGGSIGGFADMMNAKAQALGLSATHFVSPSGLDADGHYTTAYDLSRLAACAVKNERFREACSSYTATLYYGNPPYRRTLTNHNRLLQSYEGLIGVKTGFTKKSGRCLVTAANRGSATIVAVTLNDPNDWGDHRNLLDYGFSVLSEKRFQGDAVCGTLAVTGSDKSEVLTESEDFAVSVLEGNTGRLTYRLSVPEFLYAPVSKGDKVGEIIYYFDDVIVGKTEITAAEDAPISDEKRIGFLERIWICFINIISEI